MGNINQNPHNREMKAIAKRDQRDRDAMMHNQLSEIPPSALEPEDHNQRLHDPKRSLQQIIRLRYALKNRVRIPGVQADGVEVPRRRRRVHDVEARGPREARVQGDVGLLCEARLFACVLARDAQVLG